MIYTTYIEPDEAAAHLGDPDWAFIDCRFALADPEWGRQSYLQSHIPGAAFAHLNEDLSAPAVKGRTGRHPLPDKPFVVATFSRLGIGARTQVIAYDDSAGQSAAGRLWWMLKWAGHDAATVLNGGFKAWIGAGLQTRSGVETRLPQAFQARFRDELIVTADNINRNRDISLFDARSPERYRGQNEIIDPVPGHIPGAISLPFAENIGDDGRLKPLTEVRTRLRAATTSRRVEDIVMYCGSGVSATQNILAFEHAGLGTPRLYVGSWSDWITDPARPIATGDQP